MPVKNTGTFLHDCLNSIINQDLSDWELLAVDDHSTDDSFKVLQEYSKKDKRIKIFKNNETGIIAALRLALKMSKGEYITRMDSDDIMVLNKLQSLKDALTNQNDLAIGLVEYFSHNNTLGEGYKKYAEWLNTLTSSQQNFSEIYKECVVPSPCWMMHKNTLEKCGAFDNNIYPEDYDLCFRMRRSKLKIKTTNSINHRWRDYAERTSRNDQNYAQNSFIPIKMKYFIEDDLDPNFELVVWGAGKKGKAIVKILMNNNIEFKWVCNNEKKIGTTIFNQLLSHPDNLEDEGRFQIIVAVAQPKAKTEIRNQINTMTDSRPFFFS